jgi:hypothetical protein
MERIILDILAVIIAVIIMEMDIHKK